VSFEAEPPAAEDFAGRIAAVLERHCWLCAEEDGRVVGYAYGGAHRARQAYQWTTEVSVYVDGDHRRRGLGRALYALLLDALRWQRYHLALAGVTLPNDASQAFHRSMGFEPFARFEDVGYKFGRWHATEWWRRLLGEPGAEPDEPRAVQPFVATSGWGPALEQALAHVR